MRWCGRSMPGCPPTSGCCRRTSSPQSFMRATTPGPRPIVIGSGTPLSSAHSSVTTRGTSSDRWTWTRWTAAARLLEGRHDFAAFASAGGPRARPSGRSDRGSRRRRTLDHEDAARREDAVRLRAPCSWWRLIVYEITGDGFLRHMVRAIAGTLVEIGRGRRPVEAMREVWRRATGRRAGPTAPARGLFLVASSTATYNDRMSLEQLLASLPGPPDLPTKRWPARSTSISFPPTSPSSWTATAAGRPSATCRASKGTAPASTRCATSSKPRRGSASGC